MKDLTEFDRPVNVGNPRMGWASDVAAEMLRRMGIKYLAMNPGASYRGFHDSIVNYLGNKDPQMILLLTLVGFLGFAGIERFVLNQIGMGIVYFLTWGFCGIGIIVDLVNYRKLASEYNQQQAYEVANLMRTMGS